MIQAMTSPGGFGILYPLLATAGSVLTLIGAFAIGAWQERRHFQRLDMEEQRLAGVFVTDIKTWPANWRPNDATLVTAGVVIANDKFKSWLAGWANLFGGRVVAYETLLERARREALVRVQAEAERLGANAVWNVRIETSTIGGGVEALAYGTAAYVSDRNDEES